MYLGCEFGSVYLLSLFLGILVIFLLLHSGFYFGISEFHVVLVISCVIFCEGIVPVLVIKENVGISC